FCPATGDHSRRTANRGIAAGPAHRAIVAVADPADGGSAALVFPPSAASPVRGARWTLPGDLLLGFLFHHARVRSAAAGAETKHGEELRSPCSHLGAHSQRQSDLLPQPLAATVFLPHGGIACTGQPGAGLRGIPSRAQG